MPSLTVLHVMNGATGGAATSTLDLIERLVHDGIGSVAVALDAGASADRPDFDSAWIRGRDFH